MEFVPAEEVALKEGQIEVLAEPGRPGAHGPIQVPADGHFTFPGPQRDLLVREPEDFHAEDARVELRGVLHEVLDPRLDRHQHAVFLADPVPIKKNLKESVYVPHFSEAVREDCIFHISARWVSLHKRMRILSSGKIWKRPNVSRLCPTSTFQVVFDGSIMRMLTSRMSPGSQDAPIFLIFLSFLSRKYLPDHFPNPNRKKQKSPSENQLSKSFRTISTRSAMM